MSWGIMTLLSHSGEGVEAGLTEWGGGRGRWDCVNFWIHPFLSFFILSYFLSFSSLLTFFDFFLSSFAFFLSFLFFLFFLSFSFFLSFFSFTPSLQCTGILYLDYSFFFSCEGKGEGEIYTKVVHLKSVLLKLSPSNENILCWFVKIRAY